MDDNDEIVGIIDLKHGLNEFLQDFGNSGYSVRPSERRKGYATEMLRLKNGGIYERSFEFEGEIADVYKVGL